mmetsp:Transcript_12124/g.14795  ORF Transcript_12124/g.14795 Transcript_12124/m.14795 type:complete len:92 (-) Transcript_12124:504-779(-)
MIEKWIGITVWETMLESSSQNLRIDPPITRSFFTRTKSILYEDKVGSLQKTNKGKFQKDQEDDHFHDRRKHSASSCLYFCSLKILVRLFNL